MPRYLPVVHRHYDPGTRGHQGLRPIWWLRAEEAAPTASGPGEPHVACARARHMAAVTYARVSRDTRRDLEHLRSTFGARTANETIRHLLKEQRSKPLDRLQGSWKKVGPFTEAHRVESQYVLVGEGRAPLEHRDGPQGPSADRGGGVGG